MTNQACTSLSFKDRLLGFLDSITTEYKVPEVESVDDPETGKKTRKVTMTEKPSLTKQDRELVAREIVKFIMQIQKGVGSTTLRTITFRLHCLDDFTYFKNQYLDMSQYIHRVLWLAVLDKAHNGRDSEDPMVKEDTDFCLSLLEAKDLEKLSTIGADNTLDVSSIKMDENWTTGRGGRRKKLLAYAKSKLHTLSFLNEYDPGIEPEDFNQDFLCEILRVFNTYPRSKCKNLGKEVQEEDKKLAPIQDRVERYVESAFNNKVMNIKEYYSCESRRRVTTTDNDLYKQRSRLNKNLGAADKAERARWGQEIKELMKDRTAMDEILVKWVLDFRDHQRKPFDVNFMITRDRRPMEKELILYFAGKMPYKTLMRLLCVEEMRQKYGSGAKELEGQLKDVNHKLEISGGDYYSTVSPLVRRDDTEEQVVDVNEDDYNLHMENNPLAVNSTQSIEDRVWIDGVCSEVDSRVADFVKLVTHSQDPKFKPIRDRFESWAVEEGYNTDQFNSLINGAKKFCSLKAETLKKHSFLKDLLLDHLAYAQRRRLKKAAKKKTTA